MIFTAGFVGVTMLDEEAWTPYFMSNPIKMAVLTVYIMSICALICCGFDKKFPVNFALLAVFTVCVSFIVATTCARYNPLSVF